MSAATGGKARLGRITKCGDDYLRTLLIQGAKSAVMTAHKRSDRISQWLVQTRQRIGWQKTCVALANKNARSLEPTREAYDDYVARIDSEMEKTVWKHTPTAHTYYRVASGRVVIACPLLMIDWWEEHRAPIEDHFIVR